MRRMTLLERLSDFGHEQVIAFQEAHSGLRGFIAIHSTLRGPALGGVRLLRYQSEEHAFEDALRLSRAMTLKTALADLPAGGGKAVILDHPRIKRRAAFEAFGRMVEGLRGRFHTGPDVGIRAADLEAIGRWTSHVAREGDPKLGDISQHTAMGVSHAMRACFELAGIVPRDARVVIQGVGNVGAWLARILAEVGCAIVVADVNEARARRVARDVGGVVVAPARALTTACDALAPCALGGVLSSRSVPRLRTRVVCGAANNQLATPADAERLAERGILYAPDVLGNAGGVIRGAEYELLGRAQSWTSLEKIHDRMLQVARLASRRRISTHEAAEHLALSRVRKGGTR
jgi:glutamate dehydrogenase/leucine dehydrogenase